MYNKSGKSGGRGRQGGSGSGNAGGGKNRRQEERKSAGRFSFSSPGDASHRSKQKEGGRAGQGSRRAGTKSGGSGNSGAGKGFDRSYEGRRQNPDSRDFRDPRRAPRHLDSNSSKRASARFDDKTEKIDSGAVVGRNAVLELLKSGRDIDKLFVLKSSEDDKPTGSVVKIVAMALDRHIPVIEVDRRKLEELAGDTPHQGVAAVAPEKDYAELDDIFELAAQRGEKPLIVIADEINDPHNLGAIIRSAEAAGAHGVVIPKRRSAPVTPTVAKASAGAVSWLPIVKVTNLSMLIEDLRERGVWVYCAETGGADYRTLDYDTPAALIVGSEGEGVSRLLREKSDFIVSIPMKGQVNSLNVSCAAAVMLFKMTENRSPVQPEFPDDDYFEDEFDGEDFDEYPSEEDFEDTDDVSAEVLAGAENFAAIVADGDEAPEDLEDLFMLDGIAIDFDGADF